MSLNTKKLAALVGHVINSELGVLAVNNADKRAELGMAALRAVFGTIEQRVLEGEQVMIRGVGAFEVTWAPARLGYSSIKGHSVVVPGRYRVLFRPSQSLRERLCNAPISVLGREREKEYVQGLLAKLIEKQGFGDFSDTAR